jgi:hypothetical protein
VSVCESVCVCNDALTLQESRGKSAAQDAEREAIALANEAKQSNVRVRVRLDRVRDTIMILYDCRRRRWPSVALRRQLRAKQLLPKRLKKVIVCA